MDQLPDIILLEIFKKLYYVDLCKCAQVCRRWYSLAQSSCFKKKIIVDRLEEHWKLPLLVQYHFQESLEEFEVWGNSSDAFVYKISEDFYFNVKNSPRLKKLVVAACSLNSMCFYFLPASVKYVSFRKCELGVPRYLLRGMYTLHSPQLRCIDVGGLDDILYPKGMHLFIELQSLRCLFMENCSKIDDLTIESITPVLMRLEVLDVEGTAISSKGVRTILKHDQCLKELYIGHNGIDDDAFRGRHFDRLLKLRTLCVRNSGITYNTLQKLVDSEVKVEYDSKPFEVCDEYISQRLSLFGLSCCNHYLRHKCCN